MIKLLKQIRDAKRILDSNRVHIYYDHDGAPQLWDEFQNLYRDYMRVFKSHNGADYIVFGDMGRSPFKASRLKAMSKYDVGELHGDLFGHCQGGMTKSELIEELMEVTTLDFYTKRYADRTWRELDSTYTLMGYSQGDAVKVLVLDTMPEEMPAPSKDYLHNLLFDSPISGTIRFKGEHLYLGDLLDDPYEYDKAQVIREAEYVYSEHADRKETIELVAFLSAMLPTEPER